MDWYREVGVRDGALVAAGHAAPGGGWFFDVGWPRIMPIPIYAGGGPENGGLYVAPWFVLGAICLGRFLIRVRREKSLDEGARLPGRQP